MNRADWLLHRGFIFLADVLSFYTSYNLHHRTQCHNMPTLTTYQTPKDKHPRTVCFETHTDHTKRFVSYGLVTGSKSVRRELDMPCSVCIYDSTLRAIAKERFESNPIRAEMSVLGDGNDVCDANVRNALTNCDDACVQFWENNYSLFGSHDVSGLKSASSQLALYPSAFHAAVHSNDVMYEKYHGVRSTSRSELQEHLFAIACRFQINTNNNMYLYAMHIHMDKKKHVSLTTREQIWSVVKDQLLSSPHQWMGVPNNVHFKDLCEMDGWMF